MSETKTYTWVESHNDICALLRQAHDALALTSYPPRRTWVGLTDDEMWNAYTGGSDIINLDYAKAIEAKLKEKNA